jgi:ABC-2 type transport system ATP-binding protein
MGDVILRIKDLTKKFGHKTILNKVNLDIKSGEIFGIIGLSGSGKTTLLNTIIGFLHPEGGDVMFKLEHLLDYKDDTLSYRSVFKNTDDIKKSFGFAAQSPSFYRKLTSMENLSYFGDLYNLSSDVKKTNSEILLQLMGIYESRNLQASNMSGGMQKRLDIACALIHDPKLLILDEPTSDLDPILRKQMWYLIKQINEKGTTIILSSHFLDELELLCDRVGILYEGQIIKAGTPNEIKNYYSKEEEIRLETSPGKYNKIINALKKDTKELSIKRMAIEDNKLIIYTQKAERSLHQVLHILENQDEILIDVTVEKPTLHEVLERLITTKKNEKDN